MDKAILVVREYIEQHLLRTGARATAFISTFGCQANVHDSEKIAGLLSSMGYAKAATQNKADLVVYNTCCIRENAENKLLGHLGEIKRVKAIKPDLKVVICGCMMQQGASVEKVRRSYPYVDVIFGTHNLHVLPELLAASIEGGRQVVDVWDNHDHIREDLPVKREHAFKANVNIMYGCNNFCAYCVVPYVRGRERSRKSTDIIRECTDLADSGVKEVLLLGQNVNSYGIGAGEDISFGRLLRELNKVGGLERIRFMTSHPKDLSQELLDAIADCNKVCRHVHLPVQSGSDNILAKMNRQYTKAKYLELVRKLRDISPDMSITTDIIVGFPGETEDDLEQTLDVVRQARFNNAFTFKYSKRQGTPADQMENQVPEDVVNRRFNQLLKELNPIAYEISSSNLGKVLDVLTEEVSLSKTRGQIFTGRAEDNSIVHFTGNNVKLGDIVSVKITGNKTFYLMGIATDQNNRKSVEGGD